MRVIEHFGEVLSVEIQHNRRADSWPKIVPSVDPTPKFKHTDGIDTEFGYGSLVGRCSDEVFGHGAFITYMIQEPFMCSQGVGQDFLGGEGFRGDDEEDGLGADFGRYVVQLGAAHVGNGVHVQTWMAELFEHGTYYQRTEVGVTDTDTDDVDDDLVGVAQPAATTDFTCKFAHALQDMVGFRHYIFAVYDDGSVGAVMQGDVESGVVFRCINFLIVERLLHSFRYAYFMRQFKQQCHSFTANAVFGMIQCQAADL